MPVTEKSATKYLGILIDNKLNWKQHIQYIKSKLSKGIGILTKIRHFAPQNVLISLYYSFIESYTNYNILNWSATPASNLESIRMSIKKAIRVITFENKYEHTSPLFKKLGILPLDQQIQLKQAAFMWKVHNDYIPPTISCMFNLNNSEIIRRINPNKYHLPNPRLNYAKIHISYSCVKLWNTEIPIELKEITSLKCFVKKYKTILINELDNK